MGACKMKIGGVGMSGAAARTGDFTKNDRKYVDKKQQVEYCKDNIQTIAMNSRLIIYRLTRT